MTAPTVDPFEPIPLPYVQQLARAYRFLDRYKSFHGTPHHIGQGTSFNDLEDNMWAFFWNCWHVKDWIANDPSIAREVKKALLADVHVAKHLSIVADLANGTKHFTATSRTKRTGAQQSVIEFIPLPSGAFRVEHLVRLEDRSELTAGAVASKALEEWRDILQRHGLAYFDERAT
jgi:hypothetical protein